MTQLSAPRSRSAFVTGDFPPNRTRVVAVSALLGFLLTVVWSAPFVDRLIGDSIANTMLGHDAKETPIAGIAAGIVFAFVTGIAGSFTACNIAAFAAVAPMMGETTSLRSRIGASLRPLGWMSLGLVVVSAAYGALVGLVGTRMPQFSDVPNTTGLSPRSIQAMVVFGVIGLAFVYLGLAALGLVPDPFARISERYPQAPMLFVGALIGGFLIGRPFPLFRQLFRDAAESHNVLYGATAFVLQSIGNIVIMVVVTLVLVHGTGGRVQRWLTAKSTRIATLTGGAFILVGVFTFLYWDVRLLARREILPWYPIIEWYSAM